MTNKNNISFSLNQSSPWLKLDHLDWSSLVSNYTPINFSKGHVIYRQQESTDYIFIISKGRVGLTIIDENGSEKYIGIAEEGSILDELSLIDNQPSFCTATVLINSLIYKIPKSEFQNKLFSDKNVIENTYKNFAKKIRVLYTQIEYLCFKDAVARISFTLLMMFKDHSIKMSDEYKFDITFTHYDIARMTGLSRVSVSNAISKMADENILYKKNGYFYIKDLEKLKSLCN